MHSLNRNRDGLPVGLLFSDSSPTAAVEATQAAATELAISEVNEAGGINGVPLMPVRVPVGPRRRITCAQPRPCAISLVCARYSARICRTRARRCFR